MTLLLRTLLNVIGLPPQRTARTAHAPRRDSTHLTSNTQVRRNKLLPPHDHTTLSGPSGQTSTPHTTPPRRRGITVKHTHCRCNTSNRRNTNSSSNRCSNNYSTNNGSTNNNSNNRNYCDCRHSSSSNRRNYNKDSNQCNFFNSSNNDIHSLNKATSHSPTSSTHNRSTRARTTHSHLPRAEEQCSLTLPHRRAPRATEWPSHTRTTPSLTIRRPIIATPGGRARTHPHAPCRTRPLPPFIWGPCTDMTTHPRATATPSSPSTPSHTRTQHTQAGTRHAHHVRLRHSTPRPSLSPASGHRARYTPPLDRQRTSTPPPTCSPNDSLHRITQVTGQGPRPTYHNGRRATTPTTPTRTTPARRFNGSPPTLRSAAPPLPPPHAPPLPPAKTPPHPLPRRRQTQKGSSPPTTTTPS